MLSKLYFEERDLDIQSIKSRTTKASRFAKSGLTVRDNFLTRLVSCLQVTVHRQYLPIPEILGSHTFLHQQAASPKKLIYLTDKLPNDKLGRDWMFDAFFLPKLACCFRVRHLQETSLSVHLGARELARDARQSEPDDLVNSAVGGLTSGALLGRLQGGHFGAIRYSIIFAAAGTALDFTDLQLRPILHRFMDTLSEGSCDKNGGFSSWWKIPEWSPIQVLGKEALAAKQAKEEKMGAEGVPRNQNKE